MSRSTFLPWILLAAALFLPACQGPQEERVQNVVLISIDTCRADHLGSYGYRRETSPHVDEVAREGILFSRAVASVPITLPSHSSMMTGLSPLRHGVRDNNDYRLDPARVTLAEVLAEGGFTTAAFVGAFVMNARFGIDQGFDHYDDFSDEQKGFMAYDERSAAEVTDSALDWLGRHREERSFLFLHYFDPHGDYRPHGEFDFTGDMSSSSRDADLYDGEIAFTDFHIGRFLRQLKDWGLYDSTLLVVTSDHGEGLGDHRERTHGSLLYQSTLHVPLIFRVPGGESGKRIDSVAGVVDVMPTISAIVGLPPPPGLDGRDLSPLFSEGEEGEGERYVYAESLMPTKFDFGPVVSLIGSRWKFIYTAVPRLFDLDEDPGETRNAAKEHPETARALEERLLRKVAETREEARGDSRIVLDEESRRRLTSLGYVASYRVDDGIGPGWTPLDEDRFVEINSFNETFLTLSSGKRFDEAKAMAADLLRKYPEMEQFHYYLGIIAVEEKDHPAIMEHFSRYLELVEEKGTSGMKMYSKGELRNAHLRLGVSYEQDGKLSEARENYRKAIDLGSESELAFFGMGNVSYLLGRYQEAAEQYGRAIDAKSDFPEALNNLAWLRATQEDSPLRNPEEAVRLALEACRLTDFGSPNNLVTLSVAYAAAGEFPKAVEAAEKAKALAAQGESSVLLAEIEDKLNLYRRNRPYLPGD